MLKIRKQAKQSAIEQTKIAKGYYIWILGIHTGPVLMPVSNSCSITIGYFFFFINKCKSVFWMLSNIPVFHSMGFEKMLEPG